MKFLSVCSGIEAASAAWNPLGWEAVGFSDIDPFSRAFLAHRFPDVTNFGDMNDYGKWTVEPFDLLCGGTPCQAFSVAGLRAGLDDPRGNLCLVFLGLVQWWRPRWVVWENVPGVISDKTGAFGAFLSGLGELGYGWSYRVLDAQYFGVPQRRRRVFVVGYLGDWRRAAAVLFEPEGMLRHSSPRGAAGQSVAPTLDARAGRSGANQFSTSGGLTVARMQAMGEYAMDYKASTLKQRDYKDATDLGIQSTPHTLRGEGFDASEDGTGRGTPIIAIQDARGIDKRQNGKGWSEDGCAYTIDATASQGVCHAQRVRRLTPRECERLQGFPDDWTLIPYRGKPAADGPRYKAIGNSWAVPVARWIGERIDFVDSIGRAP